MRALWTPTDDVVERATLTRYMRWLDRGFADYEALWEWSTREIDAFWASLWDFFEVRASRPYTSVLGRRTMPGAAWFPGAELSYAEHIFHGRDDETMALVHASELRPLHETTWGELRAQTAAIRAGLLGAGVGRGDRVAAYMPNIAETAAAFFATASIGAIWSCASPDFGARSVIDRFAQIEPKVLLAVDGYRYGGRDFDRSDTVAELQLRIPSIERTFTLPYLGRTGNWHELEQTGAALEFEQLPFDHPLWVLYSSGTTGLPKPIVHGHGGVLLEHLKTVLLHFDLRRGDRLFWFSTTGWMMWNLLLGGLLADAAIVLYDGSPATDDMNALWELADRSATTCFGTSAAFISACMKAQVEPAAGRDLSRLRSVGSTGSPLSREGFRWIYNKLGADTWLFSMSGGTDVVSAFVGGVPTLPVHEGELQARALGARVESWNERGEPVIGEVGELVLTEPLPSMPLFLWGDEDGALLRESYFEMFPGVWRHGDWIEITERGTAIISGRSDATINRGGVRMGTSEIYSSVLGADEVVDALVVDIPRPGTEGCMLLFVVVREGDELDDALRGEIRRRLRSECSPRHVPDEIHVVQAIPRTLSGKVLEIPVKRILMGADPAHVASRDSLTDPTSLDPFAELAHTLESPGR